MKIQVKVITPALAKKILKVVEDRIAKGTLKQRTLSEPTVAKYAQDMRNGHWLLNNQGIAFDKKGNLIDGRHRLWAVTRAGVSVKMIAVYGLEDHRNSNCTVRAVDTIDCGRQRGLSQQLQISGILNASVVAAAVRAISTLATQRPSGRISTSVAKSIIGIYGEDIKKVFELLHSNPRRAQGHFLGPLAMWHASHPRKAADFINDLVEMTNLPAGSPIIAFKRFTENNPGRGGADILFKSKGAIAAMHIYEEGGQVNVIRAGGEGMMWLIGLQKDNMKKVRQFIGIDNGDEIQTEKAKE